MASPWVENSAMEASTASIWAAEEVNSPALGVRTTPFSAPLCRREKVGSGVLLQTQRGQRPHREQRRHSEKDARCQAMFGAISPETFFLTPGMAREWGPRPCSSPPRSFDQYALHQQHQQSQSEMPGYGQMVEGRGSHHVGVYRRSNCRLQQGGGAETAKDGPGDNGWSGGQSYGGAFDGCGEMASPKSSVSSDDSEGGHGGSLVDNSPAAVWQLDSTGEGGGGPPGERKRRTMGVGLQQLQMIWLRDDSASLHDNVQSIDELKKLLLCDSVEPESTRTSAREEIRKKDELIVQLLQLLKMTSSETDERELSQELFNKIAHCSPLEHPPSLSYVHPADPSIEKTRCNSGATGFDSLSFTHSHQPYSYPPVQPRPDIVSATGLPNVRSILDSNSIAMSQQPLLPGYSSSMTMELSTGMARFDHSSAIIDALVVKKPLPEKGKLLQAVMEAGPLLRTLLVAGPLPQWRNPPPLKPFQIPPVSVKACESGTFDQNAVLNPNYLVESSAKAFHCQNSLVASRVYAATSMKPSNLSALRVRMPMLSTCGSSYKVPIVKRQKI